uniref:Putative proteasome complex n=1 Tax=Anopheles marajoara TaxID=58244 RepID=A0A2M4C2E3_9DIPT
MTTPTTTTNNGSSSSSSSTTSLEQAFDHIETIDIGGHPTDIVYHRFANKLFLIITQHQKMANVYTVRSHSHADPDVALGTGGSPPPPGANSRIYTIKHTFGASSDEAEAAIRYLMNFIDQRDEIVLTLALKQIDKATLDQIGGQLRKMIN